jgi:TolB-like protein
VSAVYRFDRFEVRPAERRVLAGGTPAVLGARAFDVLVWLIEHRARLVTKQELLEAVWPGLVVEENNLSVQISALRKVLGAATIATVPGRGFRFAAEVHSSPTPMQAPPPVEAPCASTASAPQRFDKPAIAVLPFTVLSADPADALLCDGLVADITALLARVPGFFLISRASSFIFRDRANNLPEIARQLGVRYLVEGTLRTHGDTLRISTQLTDASAGHVLWDGEFGSSRKDAEDMQAGVARGIISQLQPELTRAEIDLIRRQRPDNLTAWAHYHQAVDAIASHGWSETSLAAARSHLRDAINAAPGFGLAHAYYSVLTALGCNLGLISSWPAMTTDLVTSIDEAVRLDGRSPEVLGFAGCALSDLGFHERAIEMLRDALDIDPSNAQASVALGAALVQSGRLDDGIDLMRLGMRISPRDRRLAFWGWQLAVHLLRAGRVTEALSEARIAQGRDPRFYLARILEAGAHARLGRPDEGLAPLKRARELRPGLTLDEIRRTHGERVASQLAALWGSASG